MTDTATSHEQPSMSGLVDVIQAAADRRSLGGDPAWQALSAIIGSAWSSPRKARGARTDGDRAFDAGTAARIDEALERIAAVFVLDDVATDLLLVAAAVDIDPNIAAAYGMLLGATSPRPPSVALALELAGVAVTAPRGRAALAATAPLMRWGLLGLGDGPHLLSRPVTASVDVVSMLLGAAVDDPIAAGLALRAPVIEDVAADGVAELATALAAGHGWCWVENTIGGAGLAAARTAFAAADLRCVAADLAQVPPGELADAMTALVRWAGLHAGGLILTEADGLLARDAGPEPLARLAAAPIPVVMVGHGRWNARRHRRLPLTVRCGPLSVAERLRLWHRLVPPGEVEDELLASYRLTPEQIDTAGRYVEARRAVVAGEDVAVAVVEAVRALGGMPALQVAGAHAPATFEDLEVPEETRSSLGRLVTWVRLREEVIARGAVHGVGGKGTGITALFTGGPGTGKTLAAHVIADSVGLDLMQVDLSGVIDKYIGETEKNLERVFADAENLNVVLFFDEADALFGKRSDVKDARDRFANQEVSYLLQRIEKFDGITVLATNLKGNLDLAFARRMHFIIHFPDPDEVTRRRLWANLLGRAGTQDPDDPVDVPRLARTIELAGGDLRNIVLGAVYDAAADGGLIGMRHVVAAAVREHTKLGRRVPAI